MICENCGVPIPPNCDTVFASSCVMTVITTEPIKKGPFGITGMIGMSQNAIFVAIDTWLGVQHADHR